MFDTIGQERAAAKEALNAINRRIAVAAERIANAYVPAKEAVSTRPWRGAYVKKWSLRSNRFTVTFSRHGSFGSYNTMIIRFPRAMLEAALDGNDNLLDEMVEKMIANEGTKIDKQIAAKTAAKTAERQALEEKAERVERAELARLRAKYSE